MSGSLPARLAVWAAAVLMLLAPAIWNGFPLMFYDSGAFIDQAFSGVFVAERSVFYAWFLRATFLRHTTLWSAVIVQSVVTVWVMTICVRVLAPGLPPGRFFAVMVVLVVGTGLPWYAGQILPDIFAPLMVLALYLLGFHAHALNRTERIGFVVLCIFAATSHASHLGLAGGLAIVTGLAQLAARFWRLDLPQARPRCGLPALVVALSFLLLVGSNFARTGEAFLSKAGPAFVFGRVLQDGIVKKHLDETCPQSGYRLCAYKDVLPESANDWLWDGTSPFWVFGGFEGTAEESTRIIRDSLKRYPLLHLKAAAANTVEQFFTFKTGDGIDPQHWLIQPALEKYAPSLVKPYVEARQQTGEIRIAFTTTLHEAVAYLSLIVAFCVLVASARRPSDARFWLLPFLFMALLGNAFICGVLSNPHDRYQSRLILLLPFALMLLAAQADRRVSPRPRTA